MSPRPFLLIALAWLATWAPVSAIQDGSAAAPAPVSWWDGGQIDEARFDRYLGRTLRGKPLGEDGITHLLRIAVVETEADQRGIRPPEDEVAARIRQAREAAEAGGHDLDALLGQKGLTEEAFAELMRASILHEMLVRADRSTASEAPVSVDELENWTRQRIQALKDQREMTPPGIAFQSGPVSISEAELGATLRKALGPHRLRDYARQQALQDILEAWVREQGMRVSDELIEKELDWRRQRVAENIAFEGTSYERLLESQGMSLASVRAGAELRAACVMRLYSGRQYDDAWFDSISAEQRQEFERRHGEARAASWLLLRSVDQKVDPLDLSHEEASEELQLYASKIESALDFDEAAERYSEDEPSRRRKGRLGWVHRNQQGVDPAVASTVFLAPLNQTYGPVRTMDGMALIYVSDVRPAPPENEFREKVRRGLHLQLREQILDDAGVRTRFDPNDDG